MDHLDAGDNATTDANANIELYTIPEDRLCLDFLLANERLSSFLPPAGQKFLDDLLKYQFVIEELMQAFKVDSTLEDEGVSSLPSTSQTNSLVLINLLQQLIPDEDATLEGENVDSLHVVSDSQLGLFPQTNNSSAELKTCVVLIGLLQCLMSEYLERVILPHYDYNEDTNDIAPSDLLEKYQYDIDSLVETEVERAAGILGHVNEFLQLYEENDLSSSLEQFSGQESSFLKADDAFVTRISESTGEEKRITIYRVIAAYKQYFPEMAGMSLANSGRAPQELKDVDERVSIVVNRPSTDASENGLDIGVAEHTADQHPHFLIMQEQISNFLHRVEQQFFADLFRYQVEIEALMQSLQDESTNWQPGLFPQANNLLTATNTREVLIELLQQLMPDEDSTIRQACLVLIGLLQSLISVYLEHVVLTSYAGDIDSINQYDLLQKYSDEVGSLISVVNEPLKNIVVRLSEFLEKASNRLLMIFDSSSRRRSPYLEQGDEFVTRTLGDTGNQEVVTIYNIIAAYKKYAPTRAGIALADFGVPSEILEAMEADMLANVRQANPNYLPSWDTASSVSRKGL